MNDCFRFGNLDIYGVASASPDVSIANPSQNCKNILQILSSESLAGCSFVVFPELCISGYTCGDLFFQNKLISDSENSLNTLVAELKGDPRLIAVGAPLLHKGRLYNCAVIICGGEICGVIPKINIPNYQEFYEKRWFVSGKSIQDGTISLGGKEIPFGTNLIFDYSGVKVGIEICEDLWVPNPPSSSLCQAGAEIILNLSATDDNIGKYGYIKNLVMSQSGRSRCVYAYASAGNGESSTDLVFSGINLIASDGSIVSESKRFSTESTFATAFCDLEKLRNDRRKYSTFFSSADSELNYRIIKIRNGLIGPTIDPKLKLAFNPYPFIPTDSSERKENCEEIINIQSWGLRRRLEATGCKNVIIGISGGLDSTLALLVAYYTFKHACMDLKGIHAVTMPAKATSSRTYKNALELMRLLEVDAKEINISKAVSQHFRDINHDPEVFDAVYENSQARERTQLLMDLANKYNGMVVGTGDMSELALGWCTYNGDHMSMYNVNAGVPKTLVKHLVDWFAITTSDPKLRDVLTDIIDTPISPELIPGSSDGNISQKTEDLVGPYELHDFFLYHVLRNGFSPSKIFFMASNAFENKFSDEVIKKWLIVFYRRFFSQQFKRSCMPDGPKIGSVCLSPRGDWRMPSDASARIWLEEAENL